MYRISSYDIALYCIAIVCLVISVGLILFHLMAIFYARYRLYPKYNLAEVEETMNLPGVSILKPLTGVDSKLKANLTTFFNMTYPRYELLFSVASPDDPAASLVEDLLAEFPSVDARLFVGAEKVGVNPKINNLSKAYREAKYERVMISDSGMLMRKDTLLDMMISMEREERVGMVHQVPYLYPDQRPTFTRVYQFVFFGTWHAKMYMGAAFLGINCTTGMSCVMRKDVLDDAGGLNAFNPYLAEDFFISKYFYDNNWRVRISGQPAWQNSPAGTITGFQNRLMRWHQLRVAMVPLTTIFEPITECLLNSAMAALAAGFLFPQWVNSLAYFLCQLLVWFILDYILLLQMHPRDEPLSFSRMEFLTAWVLREPLSLFYQLKSYCTREINWREKRFRLRWGGVTNELPSRLPGSTVKT